ncbi:MAG: hypothetical protein QJR14_10270 [Bacillota bacterium]|nr:hypothetical protein [Bacillota bacterium]
MPVASLVQALSLEGVTSGELLTALSRHLAEQLAEELRSRGLAWQEARLRLRVTGKELEYATALPRQAPPSSLSPAVTGLLEGVRLPGPVEGLALHVLRLTPQAFVQMDLAGGRRADRIARLEAVLQEVNRRYPLALLRGGAPAAEDPAARRRERMLSFYDPLRCHPPRGGGGAGAGR